MPQAAAAMSEDDAAEATLELNVFLSGDGGRRRGSSAFFLPSKPKPFAVAWIDPAAKCSTEALLPGDGNSKIHLPLSSRVLGDPGATVTIQILHPRFPFYRGGGAARVKGTAGVPLSSLPAAAGRTLTLPLCGPSGRARGFVCISASVFWCLGSPPPLQAIPSEEYTDWVPKAATAPLIESEQLGFFTVEPNAPPILEENAWKVLELQAARAEFFRVEPKAPGTPDEIPKKTLPEATPAVECDGRVTVVATGIPAETRQMEFSEMEPKSPKTGGEKGHNGGAWRSFLVGLASGTLAVVLMGAAGLSEG